MPSSVLILRANPTKLPANNSAVAFAAASCASVWLERLEFQCALSRHPQDAIVRCHSRGLAPIGIENEVTIAGPKFHPRGLGGGKSFLPCRVQGRQEALVGRIETLVPTGGLGRRALDHGERVSARRIDTSVVVLTVRDVPGVRRAPAEQRPASCENSQ